MSEQSMPGPWRLQGTFDDDIDVEIVSFDDNEVCQIIPFDGTWRPEEIGNAHLIAAAPELLESLKRFRDLGSTPSLAHQTKSIIEQVDLAIAKAEGRQ